MTENELAATKTGTNSPGKRTEPRTPRSIRFSNDEWTRIKKAAEARGMTAAELVRYAAVSLVSGKLGPSSPSIPSEIAAQIERIYRGVYMLSTLKRDEMVREGRQEELERITKSAIASQAAIRREASPPPETASCPGMRTQDDKRGPSPRSAVTPSVCTRIHAK